MSKTTSNNVNTKGKRETPKISTRTESTTTKRNVATKLSSTSTSSLTKKTLNTKPSDEKDRNRGPQPKPPVASRPTEKSKSKPPVVKSIPTSTHTTPRVVNLTKKSVDSKQNALQQRTTSKLSTSSTSSRKQPLRAKHTSEIKLAIQKNSIPKTTTTTAALKYANTKPNAVLDTPHNVTVSSPPPTRKSDKTEKTDEPKDHSNVRTEYKLTRKGSRVLAPDEIVVLKRESAKKRLEEQIRRDSLEQQEQRNSVAVRQEPIAFEVTFDEKERKGKEQERPKSEARERSRSRVKQTNEPRNEEDEANYSDDFDSYESDFETESSHESSEHSTDESENAPEETAEEEDSLSDNEEVSDDENSDPKSQGNEEKSKASEDTEDDSELTQDPVTVLQRDKERKLDSGHYEMNSRRNPKLSDMSSSHSTQHIVDSLDAFSLNTSDQLDSGISSYGPITLNAFNPTHSGNFQVFYGSYKEFATRPILNKRGSDLMSKIQFDTLGFTLLDLKPISYDVYMQTFGRLNTGQTATQTQDDLMHVEQQTEPYETRSMWTQHPAQYDLEMVQQFYKEGSFKGMFSQNCCGELANNVTQRSFVDSDLEQSLLDLKNLENQRYKRNLHNHVQNQRKPVNYESLNAFLLRSSLIINQILGSLGSKRQSFSPTQQLGNLASITDSCYHLETNFLNTLKVVKLFSNPHHNLFVTVHESLPETDVYKSDFSQLLMVWCINSPDKPIRLLTTWSNVARLEISHDSPDIVIAALRDGSVALWDLRETYSFCSKLDGYLTHFAATQSIVPSWVGQRGKSEILMDLGSCLDIKSFRCQANKLGAPNSTSSSSKSQFVSLHDSGILTVWSLMESSEAASINLLNGSQKSDKLQYSSKFQQKFGYSSPWARVKLIQSSIVQLKDYLENKPLATQSRFDKTKALFQKNIYSDEALKELHDSNANFGQQGLRFSSIECGSDIIYICTNRNFIMMCSKTLKPERFRRIALNESRLLFPTALKVLSNENFLAVGLSNGAVMILNCALNKQLKPCGSAEKCKTPGTPFPNQHLRSPCVDIDPISGKSCAIQNIVLNSQKSYDSMDFNSTSQEEFRPDTAAFIALIDSQQKPFELRVYDQQVILSGSVLRRNLIQSLELSSNGWRLFAVTNNRIQVYDFYMDQEICCEEEMQDSGNVMDIGCGKANPNELNLITLEKDSKVTVYILKK